MNKKISKNPRVKPTNPNLAERVRKMCNTLGVLAVDGVPITEIDFRKLPYQKVEKTYKTMQHIMSQVGLVEEKIYYK
ncbi:MAG: hypothetical protein WCX73_01495 [Candidatus Pacearchaeota archaeon]|jgi:hypothetical protein